MRGHFFIYSGIILVAMLIGAGGFLMWYNANGISLTRETTIIQPISSTTPEFPLDAKHQYISVCDEQTKFATTSDEQFCRERPLLSRARLFQINLTRNVILFFENGMLRNTFPVAYQAPYGKWFQTPTGYFNIGVKRLKFMSSIFPVWMENAVQLYEDFFIHAIPYYTDGTPVSSQFSGGCLRLHNDVAADFYATAQRGDDAVVYLSLSDAVVREGFVSPVNKKEFWIRQRFNSPLKTDWQWYEDKRYNYIQHTGVDLAPRPGAEDLWVYAIADGTVVRIIHNGIDDAGLGNALILSHTIDGKIRYALYGHLSKIANTLVEGARVSAGDAIGVVGNTGYGCNYWHVGSDGCDENTEPDIHLHLEIKTKPVLTSPIPDICTLPSGKQTQCVGYTSDDPTKFGYEDPIPVLYESGVLGTSMQ